MVVCFLSKFYPVFFGCCSAILSTAEKALYKFDITLHFFLLGSKGSIESAYVAESSNLQMSYIHTLLYVILLDPAICEL